MKTLYDKLRCRRVIPCSLFLLACFSPAVRADDTTIRKEIQTTYDRANAAAKRKDLTGAMALLAPHFVNKLGNGQTSAQQRLEQDTKALWKKSLSIEAVSSTIKTLKIKGNKAVADVEWKYVAIIVADSRDKQKPNKQRLTMTGPERDTWIKNDGKWLVQTGENLPGFKQTLKAVQ